MTIKQLQSILIFSKMDTAVLAKCLAEKQIFVKHYLKGEIVHHQHEHCSTLDVVLSGNLAAYSLLENGSVTTMFSFQKNSIIGTNLLFGENTSYPLNIYCITDCDLLYITQDAVLEFLHDYDFVMHYIKSLSMNSLVMNQKITILGQKTLRENIMDYFNQQSVFQGSSEIVLPFNKKELADYLGVQRPSLFRELKRLKDEGIIDINNRTIRLYSLVN